jgi:hypothetical protein
MLTETAVLDYIKQNLGHPVMQIEISDDQILNYVKTYTLPYFSRYKPLRQYITINLAEHPELKINETTFKIPQDDDHELITIIDVIPPQSAFMIANYPINPFPSWAHLPDHLLNITRALTQYKYSLFNFSWRFLRPDKLQVLPKLGQDWFVILGAFVHSFDTIPVDWERHFLELALADIYDYIASLRIKYQNYSTPYGDINLNADYFQTKASEKRQAVLEKLRRTRPLKICYVR